MIVFVWRYFLDHLSDPAGFLAIQQIHCLTPACCHWFWSLTPATMTSTVNLSSCTDLSSPQDSFRLRQWGTKVYTKVNKWRNVNAIVAATNQMLQGHTSEQRWHCYFTKQSLSLKRETNKRTEWKWVREKRSRKVERLSVDWGIQFSLLEGNGFTCVIEIDKNNPLNLCLKHRPAPNVLLAARIHLHHVNICPEHLWWGLQDPKPLSLLTLTCIISSLTWNSSWL